MAGNDWLRITSTVSARREIGRFAIQRPTTRRLATNLKTGNLGKAIAVAQETHVVYADADAKLGLSHRLHTVGIEIECDQK